MVTMIQKRYKFKTKNSKNTCPIVTTLTKSRKQYHKCESSFDLSEISFVIFLRLVSYSLADLRIALDFIEVESYVIRIAKRRPNPHLLVLGFL